MSKKVLVTGAGGFIGANLIRSLLKRGDEIHILKRSESVQWRLAGIKQKIKNHNIEINDRPRMLKLIQQLKPKQVFHLAQYGCNSGEDDPIMIQKVMVAGTAAVFDACSQVSAVGAVVNAGSFLEYGEKSTTIKEDMLLQPSTPYGCAKAWATLYGQYLSRQKGTPIITLRPTFVFGPWQTPPRFIPAVILSCLRAEPVKISNPKTVRDFIFVEDVVRAFMFAADNPCTGEVINIGFGKEMTLNDAAAVILRATKAKVEVSVGTPGRNFDKAGIVWQADISKAKKILGWEPKFSQKEGIIKTVEWFYENQNLYPVTI